MVDRNDLITVVIVEDHLALREGVELLLGRHGHVVSGAAGDARGGYELIRAKRPDVALVDLHLPDGSGAQLTCKLLEDDPGLRILIYTGIADEEEIGEALDCGARGFALKTGPREELTRAIRSVAEGRTYMDPTLGSLLLSRSTTDHVHELSPRQREILDLLARGLTGAQAAKRLCLSTETVRSHVRNAMVKLEARTRVHAIALALRQKEIEFDADAVMDSASCGQPHRAR